MPFAIVGTRCGADLTALGQLQAGLCHSDQRPTMTALTRSGRSNQVRPSGKLCLRLKEKPRSDRNRPSHVVASTMRI